MNKSEKRFLYKSTILMKFPAIALSSASYDNNLIPIHNGLRPADG